MFALFYECFVFSLISSCWDFSKLKEKEKSHIGCEAKEVGSLGYIRILRLLFQIIVKTFKLGVHNFIRCELWQANSIEGECEIEFSNTSKTKKEEENSN